MLAADVAAERPMEEKDKAAALGRDTWFVMGYDTEGWHIFVRCDEPDVEQVMLSGQRGSSLEMFFTPGLERVPYYQWIIRLARGEANVYHWNTAFSVLPQPGKRIRGVSGRHCRGGQGMGNAHFCSVDKPV